MRRITAVSANAKILILKLITTRRVRLPVPALAVSANAKILILKLITTFQPEFENLG